MMFEHDAREHLAAFLKQLEDEGTEDLPDVAAAVAPPGFVLYDRDVNCFELADFLLTGEAPAPRKSED